jgi:hypothetical protein
MGSEKEVRVVVSAEDRASDVVNKVVGPIEAVGKAALSTASATETIGTSSKKAAADAATAMGNLGASADKSGKQVATMGSEVKNGGELGQAGMRVLAASTHEAAAALGVPGPIARRLVSQIEETVESFGKFAGAIGGSIIVIAAIIGTIKALIEHKKNLQEEVAKSADTLFGETDAMWKNRGVTDEVAQATERLYLAKRNMAMLMLSEKIRNENEELKKQKEVLDTVLNATHGIEVGSELNEKYKTQLSAKYGLIQAERAMDIAHLNDLRANKATENELRGFGVAQVMGIEVEKEKALLDIRKNQGIFSMREQMDAELSLFDSATAQKLTAMSQAGASAQEISAQFDVMDLQRQALQAQQAMTIRKEESQMMSIAVDEEKALLDLRKAQGIMSMQEQMDAELSLFDSATAQKLTAMSLAGASAQQISAQFDAMETQRKALQANQLITIKRQEIQIENQLNDYKMSTATSFMNAINTMTHGKYRAIFIAIQAMSASNALIHGWAAAAAAIAPPPIGLGPVAGAPLAIWAKVSGVSAATAIMAQTFASPGSGGAGDSGSIPSASTGSTGDTTQSSEGPRLGNNGIEGGGTVIVHMSVVAPLGKDYSKEDWERIAELYIQPAFSANGQRGVQISSAAVATA